MPRILAACLALLLTANGWVALPASYIETGRDSARVCCLYSPGVTGPTVSAQQYQQPTASVSPSSLLIAQQVLGVIPEKVLEYRSRPVDAPPAYRLGQRPPPQTT